MLDERRPPFANDFPRTPELDALVEDFVRGDYARVRAAASLLIQSSADEGERHSARELANRTNPDRLAVGLVAIAAVLLLVLATYWIAEGRAPEPATPLHDLRSLDGAK